MGLAKRDVKVKNPMGLHTRPAASIVKMLQSAKCSVFFQYKKMHVDAKSILSILMLAAKKNAKITILADGEDADPVMEQLVEAFANQFGEK